MSGLAEPPAQVYRLAFHGRDAIAAAVLFGVNFWLLGFYVVPALGPVLPVVVTRVLGVVAMLGVALIGRRSAMEAEIGHMKTDGRLSRCPLKGTIGDALFAVLCACGHNIRKILAHLRALLVLLIGVVLELIRPAQDPQPACTAA